MGDPSALVDTGWVLMLVPIVTAIVEAVKRALRPPERVTPLLTLAVGVAAALVWFDGSIRSVTLTGVVVGLSAAGLYSGGKTLTARAGKQDRGGPG